jgi:Spy/CpxP family protein refolding chaperone
MRSTEASAARVPHLRAEAVTIRVLLAALLTTAVLAAAPTAAAQGFRWWQDEHFTRELGLTHKQSTALEEIFQRELPTLRKNRDALDAAEARLEAIVYSATERELMRQIRLVESLRAQRNIVRTVMLLRMRAVLDPDQRVKLSVLHQDWERRDPGR